MRRRSIQPPGSSLEAINVTPLIDVVMCLIIFFLIVGKLSTDRGVPVRLPQSIRGSEETSASVMIVTIARVDAAAASPSDAASGWRAYGITVQADSERQARELAADWIRDEPVAVRQVEAYEPPRQSRPSVPPAVAACGAVTRSLTREVERLLGGVRLPERRTT